MKKAVLTCLASLNICALVAQPSTYYYNSATDDGYGLKTQLHDIIDNHSTRSYSSIWDFIAENDLDTYYENDNTVLDIYSENPDGSDSYEWTPESDQCGNYSGEGSCYNREHSFPKSWFNDRSPMTSDVVHIFPTDGYVNGQRANLPYGEVGSSSYTSDNGSKRGNTRSGLGYSGKVFEPIDEFKGDLARAYFYMATRYEDVLTSWESPMLNGTTDQVFIDWALEMLIEWHQLDPVSDKERDRNNATEDFQGNRNPFVDHPEWVSCIWSSCSSSNDDPEPTEEEPKEPLTDEETVLTSPETKPNAFRYYPNPITQDVLTLLLPLDMSRNDVVIYNNLGVKQNVLWLESNKLDVSNLASGLYFISLSQNGKDPTYYKLQIN